MQAALATGPALEADLRLVFSPTMLEALDRGIPLTLAIAFTTAWMARWLWLDGPLLPGIGG